MRDGIVFLLHLEKDEAYAAALAAALAPRAVFPAPFSMAQSLSFGAGAVCVVLWTPEWAAAGGAAQLTSLCPHPERNALVVALRGATPAPEFVHANIALISAGGDAASDAAHIGSALDELADQADAKQGRVYRARLGAGAASNASDQAARSNTLVRSAIGLAATVGVVFVASQSVAGRPSVAAPQPHPQTASQTEDLVLTPVRAVAVTVTEEPLASEPQSAALLTAASTTPAPATTSTPARSPTAWPTAAQAVAAADREESVEVTLASLRSVVPAAESVAPFDITEVETEDVLAAYLAPIEAFEVKLQPIGSFDIDKRQDKGDQG